MPQTCRSGAEGAICYALGGLAVAFSSAIRPDLLPISPIQSTSESSKQQRSPSNRVRHDREIGVVALTYAAAHHPSSSTPAAASLPNGTRGIVDETLSGSGARKRRGCIALDGDVQIGSSPPLWPHPGGS
jgi:hypothetical protein